MTTRSVTPALRIVLLATAPRLAADPHHFTPERCYDTCVAHLGSVFIGQALESGIANVVDPNVTVVAKVRQALLPPR